MNFRFVCKTFVLFAEYSSSNLGEIIARAPVCHAREVLPRLGEPLREAPRLDASLVDLIRAIREQGMEGLVAKRLDSICEPGKRSGAWRKMQVNRAQEFVIGGYTMGGRTFDALILGYYECERLLYAARTRSGFTPASRRRCSGGSAAWRPPSAHSPPCPRRGAADGATVSPRTR